MKESGKSPKLTRKEAMTASTVAAWSSPNFCATAHGMAITA
jgi:hypothetical protein